MTEAENRLVKGLYLGIRKIRGEMNISPGKPLPCFIKNYSVKDQVLHRKNKSMLLHYAKLDSIDLLSQR